MLKRYFNPRLLKRAADAPEPGHDRPLRDLYPDTTPLPKEPAFRKPTTRDALKRTDSGPFMPYTVSGDLTDPRGSVRITMQQPFLSKLKNLFGGGLRTTYTLNRKLVPFYDASERMYNNLPTLTNAEATNIQAGDKDYFDNLVSHLQSIPLQDRIRAGLRVGSKEEMTKYGLQKALMPRVENTKFTGNNANYVFANNNVISIIHNPEDKRDLTKERTIDFNEDNVFNTMPVQLGSNLADASIYSHEFNHRASSPAQAKGNQFSTDANATMRQGEPSLVAPLFYKPLRWKMSVYPKDMSKSEYNAIGGDKPAADPMIRRDWSFGNSDNFMVEPTKGAYDYVTNAMEMTQGLISLNRAQNLLQQTMRRNPQAFLDAGIDQQSMQEFLNLPTFLKNPEQLDQRMEFYLNNPVFMHLLGNEPARIIPRYFMLERERRNPKRSQESRDYWQDLFDFTRANYFMARNNPANTGMSKFMQNTDIA